MRKLLGLLLAFCLGLAVAGAATQKAPDSTIIDPDVHQVVLENDHVRVLEARAAPGYKSPMHSHPPILVISLDSARLKLTPSGGDGPVIVDFRPGQVLWLDAPEHSWELLSGSLHAIGVEVKSAQAARQQ